MICKILIKIYADSILAFFTQKDALLYYVFALTTRDIFEFLLSWNVQKFIKYTWWSNFEFIFPAGDNLVLFYLLITIAPC